MDKTKEAILKLQTLMQYDPGSRGIAKNSEQNLCSATYGHLLRAAQSFLTGQPASVAITTGFFIPHATPPAPENDGPMGTCAMVRVLSELRYPIVIVAESECLPLLKETIRFMCPDSEHINFYEFPHISIVDEGVYHVWQEKFKQTYPNLKALISVERVGSCHDINSLRNQYEYVPAKILNLYYKSGPADQAGRMLNMAGNDITDDTAPIQMLFENMPDSILKIGIGDGGNEIGMGNIPWHIINQNIVRGGQIACRVKTDATLVAGVSNWGGYALAAAIAMLARQPDIFLDQVTTRSETDLLNMYANTGIAVDGVLHRPSRTVDGIEWAVHLDIIRRMRQIVHYFIDGNPEGDRDV